MSSEDMVRKLEVGNKCFDDSSTEISELIQKIVIELMDFTVQELSAYKAEWIELLKERQIPQNLIVYCGKLVDAVSEYRRKC